mgnify:CR=1 FL=1
MLRLTLDMDDVLADTHEKLVEIILNDFATIRTEKELNSRPLRELLHPKQLSKLHKIMDTPGFFADIKVKEGAIETVSRLSRNRFFHSRFMVARPRFRFSCARYSSLFRHASRNSRGMSSYSTLPFCSKERSK